MSNETQAWLDQNILVGFTHSDYGLGDAWHRRQGSDNSYPAAVPADDVQRKLFGWSPVKVTPHYYDDSNDEPENDNGEWRPIRDSQNQGPDAVVCSDNGWLLGYHSEGYPDHGYTERLLDGTRNLLGESVQIGSAGLLRGRKLAFVQVTVPEVFTHKSGETYRFNILATSSLDGSVANTYKPAITRVVCDNTHEAAMNEKTTAVKFRSTRNSQARIDGLADERDVLDLMETATKSYEQEMEEMLSVSVSDAQWHRFTTLMFPVKADSKRAITMAEKARGALSQAYAVMESKGTRWGAYQAYSTYQNLSAKFHANTVAGGRVERSILRDILGKTTEDDQKAKALLSRV